MKLLLRDKVVLFYMDNVKNQGLQALCSFFDFFQVKETCGSFFTGDMMEAKCFAFFLGHARDCKTRFGNY